jgi:hypothetical protein
MPVLSHLRSQDATVRKNFQGDDDHPENGTRRNVAQRGLEPEKKRLDRSTSSEV